MTKGSLRLRLLIAGAASILAALVLSYVGLTFLFERHVERRVEAELNVYLDQVVSGLDRGADGSLIMATSPAEPRFLEPLSGLYWQVRAGATILRSRSLWDAELALPSDELPDGAVHRHRIGAPEGASELIALERRVTLPARLGGDIMRAAVAVDVAEIGAATRAFAADLIPLLAMIAVLLIAAAYAQVTIGLRPLGALRRCLAAIRAGSLARLGRSFPDEILPLAAEVDALLEAREEQVKKARARAGDLAHGLKTPLQVLAGDVERLRTKGEAQIAAEIEQVATAMQRHVDHELARSRIAAGNPDADAHVADIVRRVVAVVARTPTGAKLDWSIEVPAATTVRIDPDDLSEALGNLVENAAHHARSRVSIRTRREAGLIVITIADDGPGIPKTQFEKALSRGGRLDRSAGGTGLGLAIVGDIAEAWSARFDIRTNAEGLEADFAVPSG